MAATIVALIVQNGATAQVLIIPTARPRPRLNPQPNQPSRKSPNPQLKNPPEAKTYILPPKKESFNKKLRLQYNGMMTDEEGASSQMTLGIETMFKKKKRSRTEPDFKFIDLFAGIGGFRIALERFNGECVFSSEWDKNSQKTYRDNFGETPAGDITKISEHDIPAHDVLCAGFPCQAFSISGKRLGFEDTRGTLFREIARIAKHHQPKVLFLENVKNFIRHDSGNTIKVVKNTLEEIGYTPFVQLLRSSDFGVPQSRERVYIIAFRNDLKVKEFKFPKPIKPTKVIKDILEPEPVRSDIYINRSDIELYKDPKIITDIRRPLQIGRINKGGQGERIYSTEGAGITLSAYGGGAASKTGAYFVDGKIRKLTPRECARLQGFPEEFILPLNKNVAYKQFGDSVSVPVLVNIFKSILRTVSSLRTTVNSAEGHPRKITMKKETINAV